MIEGLVLLLFGSVTAVEGAKLLMGGSAISGLMVALSGALVAISGLQQMRGLDDE